MASPTGSSAATVTAGPLGETIPDIAASGPFLDVPRLLESSVPREVLGRFALLLPAMGIVGIAAAIGLMLISPGAGIWTPSAALAALLVSATSMWVLARLAKLAREERQGVAQIEELVTLRHFPPAAARLAVLLARPMRLGQTRLLALIQLARVLMRYERFDDSIEVSDAILSDPHSDPGMRFAIGCGRAMAMLRCGRLYDAGDAMSQLRREVNRLDDAVRRLADRDPENPTPPEAGAGEQTQAQQTAQRLFPLDSVALTLVEMYRDIQTRHSAEALAMLEAKRLALRDGLGVRLADALALGTVAAHRLGSSAEAQQLWTEATCLVPEVELCRRYPEVAEVAVSYRAMPKPAELTPHGGSP